MDYRFSPDYFAFFSLLTALLPILWLVFSLGVLHLPAYRACSLGLAFSLLLATVAWNMPPVLAAKAALEGAAIALLPILWVIFAAFFTYNLALCSGRMAVITGLLAGLSGDRRIQALAIAWGFGGFLEAAAGFGTAVAIPASILISLGFDPLFAALVCLLANTVPVAFGVIGIPVTTLAKITELPVTALSLDIIWQLLPFALLLPFVIVLAVTRSLRGLQGLWCLTAASGLSFALAQFLAAKYIGPELPAIIGSVVSLTIIILGARFFPPSKEWRFPLELQTPSAALASAAASAKEQWLAWAPYLLLLLFVLLTSSLFPAINSKLAQFQSTWLFYDGPGGKPLHIDWILTPGTLIMLAALSGGVLQRTSRREFADALSLTLQHMKKTAVTVISIVSTAKVLAYSGMFAFLALRLAETAGPLYPVFAPVIGALGTFITGSDTSANILFGLLQKQTALQIGANPVWIAAANTSGACAAKMISPQSIAIASAAAGLPGQEGTLLNAAIKYVGVCLIGLGAITYTFAF